MGFGDKTNWIWSPSWGKEDEEIPGLLYFRKEIELGDLPVEGTLNISADTRYKLYVNGTLYCSVSEKRKKYNCSFRTALSGKSGNGKSFFIQNLYTRAVCTRMGVEAEH